MSEQDWRQLPSIIAPPPEAKDYQAWLNELKAAQEQCGKDLSLDSAPVGREELAWASSCFVCAKWMTWDRRFLDSKGRLEANLFLEDAEKRFGGYDGVVLWQAYPRIGFDDRNQFDFYRDLEGGLPHLRRVVADLQKRGVRVFVAYNPWDVGTRREPASDGEALRELCDSIGADGVFLDTLREGAGNLRRTLVEGPRPLALESELDLPPTALPDHALSWMQWPNPPTLLGVLRNHWLSPGHMQHCIRRWHKDHTHEMFLAWLNGSGMLVWENIFASWNGWSKEDAEMVHQMRRFYLTYQDVFAEGKQRPFAPLWRGGVASSEWMTDEVGLWTLANPTGREIVVNPLSSGLYDGFSGNELGSSLRMEPFSIAAIVTRPRPMPKPIQLTLLPSPSIVRVNHEEAKGSAVPFGMALMHYSGGTETARYRVRECGDYEHADFLNQSYPGLHTLQTVSQVLPELRYAIDIEEVTNAQFLEFLRESRYSPKSRNSFLEHWEGDRPKAGTEHQPVTFVDLDDARAFAKWKKKRLPTEWEWQIAAQQHKIQRGSPLAWNWTESEHSDGITNFVMLKGGCEKKVVGSDWYADGGPQEPDFMAKFVRISRSLDRCATIGFRCAMGL